MTTVASVLMTQATIAAFALLGSIVACLAARTREQGRAAFFVTLPVAVYFLGLLMLLVSVTR